MTKKSSRKGAQGILEEPKCYIWQVSQALGGFCTSNKERCAPQEREGGGPLKRWLGECAKSTKGTPRMKETNPRFLFGTLGVVGAWGVCYHIEGRTNEGT